MTGGLPDIIGSDLSVLFCGINPGLAAAAAGHHFFGRGNRFWRVINLAGFTPRLIRPEDDRLLLSYGCGITAVVDRPTARAAELSNDEFGAGEAKLRCKVERYRPRMVAFLGKAAYSAIVSRRDVEWGEQPATFGGARVWVLPNPSGLNRQFSTEDLVRSYRQLRETICQPRTR